MKRLFLALLAIIGVGLTTAAPAQAQSNNLAVSFCNYSGYDAFTAVIYQRNGQWHSQGWWRVNNGACQYVADTDNLVFYAFAEQVDDQSATWGGHNQHCVTNPGPYHDYIPASGETCRSDQRLVGFQEVEANNFGTFTWNLRP
ncbi:DUF1036 domain-containing protein [Terricaulis sp.]|uniref:DUF1036 domain-containing protein n=1 Tax=Terricaulis sp. TaxID=2768686 RepID=UPI0037849BF8